MKILKGIILSIAIILLTGCTSNKEKLEEYLKENNYEENNNCLKQEIKKEDSSEIIKFCLEDCKIYATDLSLNDYFVIDLKTRNIQYIYSYITYQSNLDRDEDVCFFQGEEIDLNSSYCKIAKTAFEKQYAKIEKEAQEAKVKLKYIC